MFTRLTWRAITIFVGVVTPGAACEEEAPPPAAPAPVVVSTAVTTRDGILTAQLPSDLHVSALDRSLLGTSADGGFRIWVEHRAGETLPEVLGTLKDELIGLGWEPGDEQHFQSAVSIRLARGPRQHRLQRVAWLIEAAGQVLICDAIASHLQASRLDQPLRELCQSLRLAVGK